MNRLVSFEGGEGCGKTTLMNNLKEYLDKNNIDYISTREPGGIEENEKIREILKTTENLSPITQILLFSASRSNLVDKVVIPNVESGKLVLMDRYFDSTRIYQGYCYDISDEIIMNITNLAIKEMVPEITFFLDIDPVVAFKRKGGPDNKDVIENIGIEYHQKVRKGFLRLAEKEPNRFVVIDATLSPEEVLNIVVKNLKERKIIG